MAIDTAPRDDRPLVMQVVYRFGTGGLEGSNSKSQWLCRPYQPLMTHCVTLSRDLGDGQVALPGPTTNETDPHHWFVARCLASAAVPTW